MRNKKNNFDNFVDHVKCYTDGGCRGNPGPGAVGILICDASNNELDTYSECIGHTTNNRAEYVAVIKGLPRCAKFTRRRVTVFCDSQLVINQMNGSWRLKDETLRNLCLEIKNLERLFDAVIYTQVNRNNPFLKKADRLLNEAFEGR